MQNYSNLLQSNSNGSNSQRRIDQARQVASVFGNNPPASLQKAYSAGNTRTAESAQKQADQVAKLFNSSQSSGSGGSPSQGLGSYRPSPQSNNTYHQAPGQPPPGIAPPGRQWVPVGQTNTVPPSTMWELQDVPRDNGKPNPTNVSVGGGQDKPPAQQPQNPPMYIPYAPYAGIDLNNTNFGDPNQPWNQNNGGASIGVGTGQENWVAQMDPVYGAPGVQPINGSFLNPNSMQTNLQQALARLRGAQGAGQQTPQMNPLDRIRQMLGLGGGSSVPGNGGAAFSLGNLAQMLRQRFGGNGVAQTQ